MLICTPRQVDEEPTKRYKQNDDKSVVAMLKKGDWHESAWEPVINYVNGHDRSGRPDKKRDNELKRGLTGRLDVDHLTHDNWLVYFKTPKSILQKSTNMQRPIQRVKFTKAIARHTKIRDQNPSLGKFAQVNLISAAPTLQNLRIGLRQRE